MVSAWSVHGQRMNLRLPILRPHTLVLHNLEDHLSIRGVGTYQPALRG